MSTHKFRDAGAKAGSELDDMEETVEARLARLRAETEAITEEMEDDLSELPDDIRNSLEAIEDRIADLYDVVAQQAAYSAEVVEEIIETRPWMSVAIAFAAGAVATLLLTPPRRPKRNWPGW